MLKNYLKIALRNLRRHPAYTFINVAGLAVGMACCLLMLLFVRDELSYDRFHEEAARVYRVVNSTSDDRQPTNANGSFSAGPALARDFPEIEKAVRFRKVGWGEKRVVARGPYRFYEDRFFFADSTVFAVFTFPFLAGDPVTALDAPNTVVITARTAARYFPGEDPLGQVLSIDPFNDGRFEDYRVTGVLRDLPTTSHIQFDLLASFSSQVGKTRTQGWGFDEVFTYVLLGAQADPDAVAARLDAFQQGYMGPEPWYSMHLQRLTDIRLHSQLRAEVEPTGGVAYVYLFSALAVVILLIACINFMNLATARSAHRTREVGLRKALGAQRSQLIHQFLGEAVLLSGLAIALATILVMVLLPVFNDLAGKTMTLQVLDNVLLWGAMVVLALVAGVLAGSYPALFLSAFRPIETLKGQASGTRRQVTLRKGLVVFQFAVSIGLICCTALVAEQMDYMRTKNLGFDREQVVIVPLNDEIRQIYTTAKREWLQHPGVRQATLTEQVPAKAGNGASYRVEGIEEAQESTRFFADQAFTETYGIAMVAGRAFSEEFPSDSAGAFLVNEAFVQAVGWTDPEEAVGKGITMRHSGTPYPGTIIGVTQDFHLFSLHQGIWPVVINIMPLHKLNFVSFRIASGDVAAALDHLETTWATFAPRFPFDYYFLDADYARLHAADARLGRVFRAFAVLAVLVACLGLFGLAAFTAEQRTKEIGVRKVLGASVTGIVLLLSKDFVKLVALAFMVAAPVAYLAMSRWLEDFVYRVDISGWIFLIAGLAALGIALLTVSYQSIRAALADPVKALRYE